MKKKNFDWTDTKKDYDLVKDTSHLLDSIWIRKDKGALRIVFATGLVMTFMPEDEIEKINHLPDEDCDKSCTHTKIK